MKSRFSLAILVPLFLVACDSTPNPFAPAENENSGQMMEEDQIQGDGMQPEDSVAEPEVAPVVERGEINAYGDFDASVVGNGETSILFFAASWCPQCQMHDKKLQAWFPSENFVPVYKVDYDTETDLKAQYGVVQQHTFVKVDGAGNALTTITGPTDAQLMGLFEI